MDINQLTEIVKKKISDKINVQNIIVEDKTFLHKNHKSSEKNKFHLKITIKSNELNTNNVDSTRLIYKILDEEIKQHIHSIQILFTNV
tara:strand:- start:610 stop:873 length:264 start_codon:yes stop_codon:yes gene_type:complete